MEISILIISALTALNLLECVLFCRGVKRFVAENEEYKQKMESLEAELAEQRKVCDILCERVRKVEHTTHNLYRFSKYGERNCDN